jgi:transposase
MAVRLGQPPEGCLFCSDRSSQYCSYEYHKNLQAFGLQPLMSGKGNCYDNASVETFFQNPEIRTHLATERANTATGGSCDLPIHQWLLQHPRTHLASWSGILQADAYSGYGELYAAGREPGPVLEADCFAHARRKFFERADVAAAARKESRNERAGMIYPIALEAVQRLDALFDIERAINSKSAAERLAIRQDLSAPLIAELHDWLTSQFAKLSRNHDLAKAINYMLRRWDAFTRFLDDGRVCLTNNAAERALRCVPLGRKAWLFCGSDRGGQRAAVLYTLIQTARLNDVDPQAWLANVLARIADHPGSRLDELLPWNWTRSTLVAKAA